MTREEIWKVLEEEIGNIAPEVPAGSVGDNEDIREAFDIDSMGFLVLVTALHRRLGVNVPETDYPRLFTKAGAIEYLSSHL